MSHACHGICTLLPLHPALTMRFAKNTQRCHAKWRWRSPKCCACRGKIGKPSSESYARAFPLSHRTTLEHIMKHAGMSRSATPATRNDATRRLKPPKVTTSTELARGNAILPSPWASADGCGHKSSVERTHPNPQTAKLNENLSLRIREKNVAFQTIGFPKVEDEWTVKWFGHLWGFKNCEVNRVKQPASSNRLGFRTRKVNALTKYRWISIHPGCQRWKWVVFCWLSKSKLFFFVGQHVFYVICFYFVFSIVWYCLFQKMHNPLYKLEMNPKTGKLIAFNHILCMHSPPNLWKPHKLKFKIMFLFFHLPVSETQKVSSHLVFSNKCVEK